jgi:hypothetical protein
MGRTLEKRNVSRAVLGAASFLLVNSLLLDSAFAAPPLGRQSFRAPGQPQAPLGQSQGLLQHLDLRAPSHLEMASRLELAGNAADRSHSFAAPTLRQNLRPQEQVPLSAMAADGMRTRPALQDFVRRVRREGLPVARLFESKSALVHVGLSPKGKPGLWLVQKFH